ncbi:hypothetical protein D3C81_479480 [compost metagenome]
MYTYKRAVGINQLFPRGEELVDISTLTTRVLVSTYRELKIVVTDSLYSRDVTIDMQDYRNQFSVFNGTIQQWLDTMASTVLKTSNTLPGTEYRWVTCHDIQYEWFTLFPGNAAQGDDKQDLLDIHNAPDIRVIKTDKTAVDYDELVNRGLWTYNGHLVRGVSDKKAVYLLNAGKHFHVNDNCHVTYLNFNTVSKLKTYAIKETDIEFEGNDEYIYLHLRAPVSLKSKTLWMSIGGRLTLNDIVESVSDRMVVIRTEKMDMFNRIFDSKGMIDLSAVIDEEREVVGKDFFRTKDFWVKLLTDPSSFFIVLDNPNLYVSLDQLSTYQYPFTYHTEEQRHVPLMLSNGLLPKYYTRKIINRRLLDIDLGTKKNYLNKTTGIANGGNLHHGYNSRFKPSSLFNGYLLYIRSVIQGD